MKVIIQVGHDNIRNLTSEGLRSYRSVSALRSSTGGSGERDYFVKVAKILQGLLEEKNIEAPISDATYNNIVTQKADLFISLHSDGDADPNSGNRCMITSPARGTVPPYLYDEAHAESDRFCDIWKKIYPPLTGTINKDNFITAGMLHYYAFDYVNEETPAVIIEHFDHTSPEGRALRQKPELVAKADALAIFEFLGIEDTEVFSLKADITSSVEEAYKLKTYDLYNKYWTFEDLIINWTELATLIESYRNESEDLQEVIRGLRKDIVSLTETLTIKGTEITELNNKVGRQQQKIDNLLKESCKDLTIGEVLTIAFESIRNLPFKRN